MFLPEKEHMIVLPDHSYGKYQKVVDDFGSTPHVQNLACGWNCMTLLCGSLGSDAMYNNSASFLTILKTSGDMNCDINDFICSFVGSSLCLIFSLKVL